MKNLFKVFFLVAFLLGSLAVGQTTNATQHSKEEKIVYKKAEIKDLEKLYERAKDNINDRKTEFNTEAEVTLNNKKIDEEKVDVSSTTQLLEQKEDSSGEIESYYATTTFVDDFTTQAEAASSGSRNANKWDSSKGVKAYSTVYYNISTQDTVPFHDMTKVTGGWTRDDSSIALSGRKVELGQSGGSKGCGAVSQSKSYSPTGNTYSYTPPSSWCPVSTKVGSIGTNSTVTLKRGGSTWTLKLVNNN
ncbi:hypothetical protein [Peribacillus simplex]|uniref:hypothetical protein n=1 Tax=Peribacillus simplex TaxID=1478 RepID=UPI003D26D2C8